MSLIQRKFPAEFLYLISKHLSFRDHYQCLCVCKSWHSTFQRVFYRKIYIYSDKQLELLLEALQQHASYYGNSIKEIYLVSEKDDYDPYAAQPKHITLSQAHIELFSSYCPDLEVLEFDISQWENIKGLDIETTWTRMRRFAPIRYSNFNSQFLSPFHGVATLTHLHVQYNPDELEDFIEKIHRVPLLEELTLEEALISNDDQLIQLPLLSQFLKRLHQALPQLKKFSFIRSSTPTQESSVPSHDTLLPKFTQPSNLRSLSLQGHVDSIKWFEFLSSNYPYLEELELARLTTSRFGTKWMWQNALVQMIQSLPYLKTLKLGGKNAPQLFSKSLALELNKPACSIQHLYVDFQTFQAIESCQFLLLVASHGFRQLKFLRLRVWEQIPGWSGVTSNLFHCQQLVSLELSLSKGLLDQFPFTPFLIDHLLSNLPQLENLTLIGANVQVTYNHFADLDTENKHFALQKVELRQSKVENHENVFLYLSQCCPDLESIILYKCETAMKKRVYYQQKTVVNTCDLLLAHSTLQHIVLSTYLIYVGTIQRNDYIGVELVTGDTSKLVWCSTIKSRGDRRVFPAYEICEDEDTCLELTEIYRSYRSSYSALDCMPGCYTPAIGVITIQCKKMLSGIALDNLKIPLKLFQSQ